MSYVIHPLFKTRGVPGTHDINLIKNFFSLIKKKKFKKIKLPKFDKSKDDRLKKNYWPIVKKIHEIVNEIPGGAHRFANEQFILVKKIILLKLQELANWSIEKLVDSRNEKFLNITTAT